MAHGSEGRQVIGALDLARLSCGGFFLVGLLTGLWKYRHIAASPGAAAPASVDICHRASLMYAFACLVLAEFARLSRWPDPINTLAVAGPVLFFGLAVLGYVVHGLLEDTDNQLAPPHRLGRGHLHPAAVSGFIYLLATFEIGGFAVLFAGYLRGRGALA